MLDIKMLHITQFHYFYRRDQ